MRPQGDIDAEAYEDRQLELMAKRGEPERLFVEAVRSARAARTQAGLDCSFDGDGNGLFTAQQGIKAAVYAREDSAATLILQVQQLKALQRLQKYMFVALALLAYIAARLS